MALDKKMILEEEFELLPTIKGLYDGTLCVMCPTCGAGIPESDVRDILKMMLREANPELYKKMFNT